MYPGMGKLVRERRADREDGSGAPISHLARVANFCCDGVALARHGHGEFFNVLLTSFQRLFGVRFIGGRRLVAGWLEDGRRMVGGWWWLGPNVTLVVAGSVGGWRCTALRHPLWWVGL